MVASALPVLWAAAVTTPSPVERAAEVLAKHRQEHQASTGDSWCGCLQWRGPFTMFTGPGSFGEHLAEQLAAANLLAPADGQSLAAAIEALADEWRDERLEYPTNDHRASVALTAVRLCEDELRAVLAAARGGQR